MTVHQFLHAAVRHLGLFLLPAFRLQAASNPPTAPDPVRSHLLWFGLGAATTLVICLSVRLSLRRRRERGRLPRENRADTSGEDPTELVCRHLADGTLTYANEAYCRYFDQNPADWQGQNHLAFVPPADQAGIRAHFASLEPANPEACWEHRVQKPEGEIRWQQWTRRAIFDRENRAVEFHAVGRDITGLRETPEAPRKNGKMTRIPITLPQETLVLADSRGIVLTLNRIGAGKPGKIPAELVGTSIFDHLPDEVAAQRRGYFSQVIRTGRPVRFEDRPYGRDFVISFFPVFDHRGQAGQVAVFAQDCTERKLVEKAFREREQTLNSILTAAPIGIGLVRDRILTWASDNLLKMLGCPHFELVGKWTRALYESEEEYRRVEQVLYRCITEQGSASVETCWVKRDGRSMDILLNAAPLDPEDLSAGLTFTAMDITERKQAEEALNIALAQAREARDKTEVILRSMADGLVFTDGSNRIVLMSESAETMLGKPLRQVFLQPAATAIESCHLVGQLLAVQSGVREESTVELELPYGPGGKPRTVQAKSSVVKIGDGGDVGVITLLRDVSRERDLDRMKTEFVSTAAHELRTPLTAVMGYSELLLDSEDLNPQQAEYVTVILKKSEVLEKIIDELLDLARIDSGQVIRLHKDWADLGLIVRRSIADIQHACPGHRFAATIPDKALALIDDRKLFQVMENLLGNAVKFSPKGSLIEVICEVLEQEIRVAVGDEGIGMTPEQAQKVFDKFYRADASNTAKGGLGLGMAIVQNIIHAHQGRVWIDSSPGAGTTVTFAIPAGPEAD